MKAFAQLLTVAGVFVSVVLPVLAAPASDCAAGVDCLNTEFEQNAIEDSLVTRDVSLVKSAKEFINFMKKNPREVNKKSICFYTGGTKLAGQTTVTPTFSVLDRFAKQVNCQIIQDLLRLVPASFQDQGNWNTEPEWSEVSKVTAQLTARNPTYVLLGELTKPDSIWETVEKPVLKGHLRDGTLNDVQIWTFNSKKQVCQVWQLERLMEA